MIEEVGNLDVAPSGSRDFSAPALVHVYNTCLVKILT